MSARRRTATATVTALLGTLALTGCEAYDLPLPGSPVDDDNSFEITAEFHDVLNLVPRSPVKVNDVTVGEVVELGREGWHATATLRIQDDVELPADVYADIRQTSLLGEKYVELVPPRRHRAAAGAAWGTATPSRWSPPAATPSSRRCSAPSRCSSTAAGSGSWRSSRAS